MPKYQRVVTIPVDMLAELVKATSAYAELRHLDNTRRAVYFEGLADQAARYIRDYSRAELAIDLQPPDAE